MGQLPAGFVPDAQATEKPAGFVPDGFVPDTADFKQTDTSPNEVDPNTLGTFASHAWQFLNPVTAVKGAVQAVAHPVDTAKAIGNAHLDLLHKAKAEYDKGNTTDAAVHLINAMIPFFGPSMDKAAESIRDGKLAAGLGDAVGMGLSVVGPKMLGKALAGRTVGIPGLTNANPEEAAAVQFGQSRGIPVDAATATGNRAVKGVQHLADRSLGGSLVSEGARQASADALKRVGGELADEAHAVPVTPEQAGAGVRGAMEKLIGDLHGQATDAYEKLRRMEADPANADQVPSSAKPTAAELANKKTVEARMQNSLKRIPSEGELRELRRIKAEMDALPFTPGKLVNDNPGVSSETTYIPRSGGAPVYDDIMQMAPGTSKMTRGEIRKSIDSALETGHFTNGAKGALEVAKERLAGRLRENQMLPPSAGDLPVKTETMLMPVDIRPAKAALGPMYQQLKREAELVPLQGGKARSLVALDRLLNGPDHAPVSVVDAALGDLKSMARGADLPALRTGAQGLAANAVKQLDGVVRLAVARAGPEAMHALDEGRSATVAKYQVADVLDKLHTEPVRVMRQLTAPRDSAIDLLRKVDGNAPSQVEAVSRGYLEDLLSQATADGGFDKTGRLHAEWQKLGTQTKKILFPRPGQTAMLDHFFLLAKKMNEVPNPSGTAHVAAIGETMGALAAPPLWVPTLIHQLGGYGLSKMLHSPAGVRALSRGLSMTLSGSKATAAAKAAAYTDIVSAARSLGVPLAVPAGQTTPTEGRQP